MSTGDQSQYIRGKIAQRGLERGAHFMEDGFDRWAESTAPARVGQMEKMGAEPIAENYGGAMTLKHAKKLHMMGGMRGGIIQIPDAIQTVINQAKNLANMWKGISQWINNLKQELNDEIISNPRMRQDIKDIASDFVGWLNAVSAYQGTLDAIAHFVGSGRHGGAMHGGATTLESIGKAAAQVASYYAWIVSEGDNIRTILKMKALNEGPANNIGNTVLGYIDPILKAIGAGRHGGAKHCMCDDMHRRRKHGGALPVLDINTGQMETKPNAHRKVGGRRKSCSSEEYMGGNKLLDASPQSQSKLMKEITGMGKHGGKKHGGAGLLEKLELMSPEDRKHYDYNTVIKPSRVVGGKKHGGAGLLEKLELMSPEDRKHYDYNTVIKPSRVVGGKKHGGRGMEPRGLLTFPESMGSGKSKLKVGGKKSARGEVVKKVMREQGLSLPQASKYVKEHGLY